MPALSTLTAMALPMSDTTDQAPSRPWHFQQRSRHCTLSLKGGVGFRPSTAQHCTALHALSTLHCTGVHCTVLVCTGVHRIQGVPWPPAITPVQVSDVLFTALYILNCTAVLSVFCTLYFVYCTLCSLLQCTALYCRTYTVHILYTLL